MQLKPNSTAFVFSGRLPHTASSSIPSIHAMQNSALRVLAVHPPSSCILRVSGILNGCVASTEEDIVRPAILRARPVHKASPAHLTHRDQICGSSLSPRVKKIPLRGILGGKTVRTHVMEQFYTSNVRSDSKMDFNQAHLDHFLVG